RDRGTVPRYPSRPPPTHRSPLEHVNTPWLRHGSSRPEAEVGADTACVLRRAPGDQRNRSVVPGTSWSDVVPTRPQQVREPEGAGGHGPSVRLDAQEQAAQQDRGAREQAAAGSAVHDRAGRCTTVTRAAGLKRSTTTLSLSSSCSPLPVSACAAASEAC